MSEKKSCTIKGPGIAEYETINIAKTNNVCPMCEDYAKKHSAKPVAVICCEGACLRGEVARQAANMLLVYMLKETSDLSASSLRH